MQGPAVPRRAFDRTHPDRRDFPRVLALGIDPDSRVARLSRCTTQTEVAECVDHHLFERMDVGWPGRRVARHRDNRIGNELSRTVEGHVTAAVGLFQGGTDAGGIHQDVGGIRPDTERVDVGCSSTKR